MGGWLSAMLTAWRASPVSWYLALPLQIRPQWWGRKNGPEDEDYWIVPMLIHKLSYKGPDNTTPRFGRLDSGSSASFVSQRILIELGFDYYNNPVGDIYTIGGEKIQTAGHVPMAWNVRGFDKDYTTDFVVIPVQYETSFDFLLGRDWIASSNAVVKNREVLLLEKMPYRCSVHTLNPRIT